MLATIRTSEIGPLPKVSSIIHTATRPGELLPAEGRTVGFCRQEGRVIVTLDHDFGQTLRFPPEATAGIVVLECKGRVTPTMVLARLTEFVTLLRTRPIDRALWIVEPGRVRIHDRR